MTRALPAPRARIFKSRAFVSASVAFACLLTVVGVLFGRQHTQGVSAAPPGSLAVLPFQPLGSAADDDHLGLGVADAIITRNLEGSAAVVCADNRLQLIFEDEGLDGVDRFLESCLAFRSRAAS